jgi:hypothetical protein
VGIHDLVNVFLYFLDAQKFWKYIFISVMIKRVIVDIVKCASHKCIYMLVCNLLSWILEFLARSWQLEFVYGSKLT